MTAAVTAFGGATGLLIGAAYGYGAQRGAFCMNSGFRVVVTEGNTTKVKAYALAIAIQMVVVPIGFALGFAQPTLPATFPLGALVGGLLFGASMHYAGGCAAGIWYKAGAGSHKALAAIAGMALGAATLEVGPLSGLRAAVQAVAPVSTTDLPWAVAPLVGLLLLVALSRATAGTAGDWSWRRTGLWMGLISAVAWPLSSLAGRDYGMAVVPGTVGLVTDPLASGAVWDVLFVLGIPLGAHLATRRRPATHEPVSAKDFARPFVGGFGLGVGASLAAGCTVGHGLVGVPLLAPGSLLTIGAIFAGSALTSLWSQRRVDFVHIGDAP